MPFKAVKVGEKYRLYNLAKKKYAKPFFNSKKTANSAAKNYMRYRGENK